jgi:8-oxo-dGTP pyrophosphatase MutT (NUDIX family)
VTENEARATGWPAHRVTGVDVWPYRLRDGVAEFLLLHRSGRDGPPFWQGVSGWIEADEAPHVAALRELREETGLETDDLYSVDAVFDLYKWRRGTVEATVPFAARLTDEAVPVLSDEHDDWRWASLGEALALVPYEPQRIALRRIAADLLDRPASADLYRVDLPLDEGPEKTR